MATATEQPNIANEVTMFLTIGEGLRRHDRRMHDARPDGEGIRLRLAAGFLAAAIKKMPSTA